MAADFHRPDHSPFAGFGVGLAFGLRPDGSIVTIGEVASGKACDCVCPACGEDLVAKKGERITDHFAHKASGAGGCGLGIETNAHLWAKAVLGELKQIHLPSIEGKIGDRKHQTHKGRSYVFADAVLEKRLGEIVPDVVLVAADGRRLIVEVLVTHACDAEKIAKIRAGAVSAIEVDLSAYRTQGTEAAVRNALLRTAPRTWLFNPAVDEAETSLKATIAAERKAAAEARQRAARRAALALRAAEPRLTPALQAERQSVLALGLQDLVGAPPASDDGFVVPSNLWRAVLINRLVLRRAPTRHGMLWPIEPDEALSALKDCLAPGVLGGVNRPTPAAMKAALPGFVPPQDSLDTFLETLKAYGLLLETKHGLLVNDRAREVLLAREAALKAANQRWRQTETLLDGLFETTGAPMETPAFSLTAWRASVPGFNRSLTAIIEEGGPEWSGLVRSLDAVQSMISGGAPCDSLMGLPFEPSLQEAIRQADLIAAQEALAIEAAERAAADQRVSRLRSRAEVVPGLEVEAWLNRQGKGTPLTPLDAARQGEAMLGVAFRSLDRIAEEFADAARRDALAAECLAVLETAAEKCFDEDRRRLFLRGHRPELGMKSPQEFCRDHASLKVLLSLLPSKRGAR